MKTSIGCFILSLFLLLPAGYANAQKKGALSGEQVKDSVAGAPRIKFAEQRFEAGTVKEGTLVCHDFEFTNEGTGVLHIWNVIPA